MLYRVLFTSVTFNEAGRVHRRNMLHEAKPGRKVGMTHTKDFGIVLLCSSKIMLFLYKEKQIKKDRRAKSKMTTSIKKQH